MRFFKNLVSICIVMMTILLLSRICFAYDSIKESVIKHQKIDLTQDGIQDTFIIVKKELRVGRALYVETFFKVFDGKTGKNIFPIYHFGHYGIQNAGTVYDYRIINGNIAILRDNFIGPSSSYTIITYKYYAKFDMFMENKYTEFTPTDMERMSRNSIFSSAVERHGKSLEAVRTVRAFMYYMQNNQDKKAKKILNMKVLRSRLDITADIICEKIKGLLIKNNNNYQINGFKFIRNRISGKNHDSYKVNIYFPKDFNFFGLTSKDGSREINFYIDCKDKRIYIW